MAFSKIVSATEGEKTSLEHRLCTWTSVRENLVDFRDSSLSFNLIQESSDS